MKCCPKMKNFSMCSILPKNGTFVLDKIIINKKGETGFYSIHEYFSVSIYENKICKNQLKRFV